MRLFLLCALTMTAFAANSVLNRAAIGEGHAGPVDFAAVRLVSGAIMLWLLVWWGGRRPHLTAGAFRQAGALLLYMVGFSVAYLALPAGTGALILFGGVQLTMFAGAVLSREAVPARRWQGAA
ncbi:MAG: hypothetical protein RLZZ528_182, partial [Pseudomonadota bacterium]